MTCSCTRESPSGEPSTSSGAGARVDEKDWQRLVEQIRTGDCTPFLGVGASTATLPTGRELSDRWAGDYGYPFEGGELHDVMQFAGVVTRDLVTVKQRLAQQLSAAPDPDFTAPLEPHALLARVPISVYLTTNFDDYMSRALQRAGKQPTTAVCPWYRDAGDDPATSLPAGYQPGSDRPLVYHLHGNLQYPPSLVVAEQDYVEFLASLMHERGAGERKVIPAEVKLALTRKPLLFIGYSLRDWSFRMLFHGFVRTVANPQRRRHVSVQLPPTGVAGDADSRHRAVDYLNEYYEQFNIAVFWGTAAEFCAELAERLDNP